MDQPEERAIENILGPPWTVDIVSHDGHMLHARAIATWAKCERCRVSEPCAPGNAWICGGCWTRYEVQVTRVGAGVDRSRCRDPLCVITELLVRAARAAGRPWELRPLDPDPGRTLEFARR